jgi:hypothetical protein
MVDTQNGIVKSITGELKWNYQKGVVTVNAPMVQGVCGFLEDQGPFELREVIIRSGNPYAAVQAVSMDVKELSTSSKILVQVGTVYQPTGWKEEPTTFIDGNTEKEGYRILDTGKMPWQGEEVDVRVSLKTNPFIQRALVLNSSGYKIGKLKPDRKSELLSFTLPQDAMYIILTDGTK